MTRTSAQYLVKPDVAVARIRTRGRDSRQKANTDVGRLFRPIILPRLTAEPLTRLPGAGHGSPPNLGTAWEAELRRVEGIAIPEEARTFFSHLHSNPFGGRESSTTEGRP